MTDKTLTMLGFAAKAGRLSFGMDAAVSALRAGRAKLIVICRDVSEKSRKEILFHADRKNIPAVLLQDSDIATLSAAVGRKCGILSVNDSSFADAVSKARSQGGNANEHKI